MKNSSRLEDIRNYVYGKDAKYFDTIPTKAADQVVKIDYKITGCPVNHDEFIKVFKLALRGISYVPPQKAVCVDCKHNENECMYDRGVTCLGPVTLAGCDSWCVNNGNICYGCRGMLDNPAKDAQADVLKKYGISAEWIISKMNMYNKAKDTEEKGVK